MGFTEENTLTVNLGEGYYSGIHYFLSLSAGLKNPQKMKSDKKAERVTTLVPSTTIFVF